MTDILTFIRARLDEDEQIAQGVRPAELDWHLDEVGDTVLWWPPEPEVAKREVELGLRVTSDERSGQTIEYHSEAIAAHIARHDPARVLRQVAAIRAVIAGIAYCADPLYDDELVPGIAAIWSTHPDFDPGWSAVGSEEGKA